MDSETSKQLLFTYYRLLLFHIFGSLSSKQQTDQFDQVSIMNHMEKHTSNTSSLLDRILEGRLMATMEINLLQIRFIRQMTLDR